MIKGKSPFPFETIALALAFSPRLEALIAETRRLQLLFGCRVVFIHVGKKTSEKQRQLSEYLNRAEFSDANSKIYWEQGVLVDAITRVCKLEVVDLLLLGALQKENALAYYMGTVSRDISRKAKCSVLLLTEPHVQPIGFKRVVVNGHEHPKTIHTLNTAIYWSNHEGSDEVSVVTEVDVPVLSMSLADDASAGEMQQLRDQLLLQEEIRHQELRASLIDSNIPVTFSTISGRSGHSLGQFARSHKADLLAVNSPDHSLSIFDRIFTHDIEYLLSDLPCNLLIVHSRINDSTDLSDESDN
jgi:nucleotide-binding universal stress UspA family protein